MVLFLWDLKGFGANSRAQLKSSRTKQGNEGNKGFKAKNRNLSNDRRQNRVLLHLTISSPAS
ncbi:hypothetical protein FRX31_034641, partial [Thalictrum thalictroides]